MPLPFFSSTTLPPSWRSHAVSFAVVPCTDVGAASRIRTIGKNLPYSCGVNANATTFQRSLALDVRWLYLLGVKNDGWQFGIRRSLFEDTATCIVYIHNFENFQMPIPTASATPLADTIVEFLLEQPRPILFNKLCKAIGAGDRSVPLVRTAIDDLREAGVISEDGRGGAYIPGRDQLIRGRVTANPGGFGFLVRDDGQGDVYLPAATMGRALDGDNVLVRLEADKGRASGVIILITSRSHRKFVGRVIDELPDGVLLRPEDLRINHVFHSRRSLNDLDAKLGQVVVADIVTYPDGKSLPTARVTEIVGKQDDDGIEIEIALRKHELPFEFSTAALAENEAMPAVVSAEEKVGRIDLSHLPFVTIDGPSAKDFDDAVYAERAGKDWRLVVAVADVSHYIRPGSQLDIEALERGTSVYFPRRVIPMLPERLSNGICSLNPKVDRLAVVCDAVISNKGQILSYEFYTATFVSYARLTYAEVWSWLRPGAAQSTQDAELLPAIQNLHGVFKSLSAGRRARAAIDFDAGETQMLFDEHGKILDIQLAQRNDAHRLIEECMLVANVCAANFLLENKHQGLYRVHEGPSPERLAGLRAVLAERGLSLSGGDTPKARDYSKLVADTKPRLDGMSLQTLALRSLSRARYSSKPGGHFGLAYEHYTHFTSPIRRYPDLLVHRAIKSILSRETYALKDWESVAEQCSSLERRADDASTEVENWLKCFYMKDRVGEVFDGQISSVAPFGVFVTLTSVYVSGLVPVADLGSDFFAYDRAKQELLGERTGQRYRIGDPVRIKLVSVDMDAAQLTFCPAEGETNSTRRGVSQPWKVTTA